ncbi:MAG TPA: DPP IV N-terminal domain-containing protein [Thermoanaerobaculia bacterium]|nr:DPP IV N-terminal domain-containing protein [Thermoanaerobaculia bacterium]
MTLRRAAVVVFPLLLVCTGFAAGAAAAQDAAPQRPPALSYDRIFADDADGELPEDLTWSPDGRRLAFLFDDPGSDGEDGEAALWVIEPPGEARRVVGEVAAPPSPEEVSEAGEEVREAEEAAGDADDAAAGGRVESFAWAPDGEALVVVSEGDLWWVTLADGAARRLTATEEEESAPTVAPDGGAVAFVRDFDLWLLDLDSGAERALTEGGTEDEVIHADTDWVYWEEIWGRSSTGYWWSPDGARIAFYRFEEEPVETYPLVDFTTVPYPTVTWQKYPKAGTANPRVRIGVVDVASGALRWLDTGPDPAAYLARVHWRPDAEALMIERLAREQDRLDLLLCDPADGSCPVVHSETWPTWVNLGDDFRWLSDGRFVRGSERTGWRHLDLHAADGTLLRALTAGEWSVTSLDAVDEERGRVLFTSFGPGPLGAARRRVATVPLAAGPDDEVTADLTVLTPEEGWHSATAADGGRSWVHTWSDADTPPRMAIRDLAGRAVAALPSRPPVFDPAALPAWRFFTLAGPDGVELPARTLDPATRPAGGEVPALMYHYGGPGSQVVVDRWGGVRDLWHKRMAQRGYAVLAVDNQASIFFGKAGEDRLHRRFGPTNLAAQRAAAAWLAGHDWIDGDRIGLWGWSGGGSNTLYCLFNAPGTWRAGVSGAPVTDWRLYDTIWTERYLDHPDDNAEGYVLSSPITYASKLEDRLLVVHGTADDNVHPQNTIALAAKLVSAGKPFEDAVYPRQKHGFRGPSSRHFYERMERFFDEALRRPDP